MLRVKKYIEGDLTQRVNNCAVAILENNPDLSKFHMKIKIEAQRRYRITLHGQYKGIDVCSSEQGLDIWMTFKLVENKFLKQIKKAKLTRLSKIKRMRSKMSKIQGGINDVVEARSITN